jgi:hypothetical protein
VAVGFGYAHYFSLLLWRGRAIGDLTSNALGHGTSYCATVGWHINYQVMSINAIWYAQVGSVVGHVSGLALARKRALVAHRSVTEAVCSQYWMLVVMVGFTSLGLWLLRR